jgi:hypothetical protein
MHNVTQSHFAFSLISNSMCGLYIVSRFILTPNVYEGRRVQEVSVLKV